MRPCSLGLCLLLATTVPAQVRPVEVPHARVRHLGENATTIGCESAPPGVPRQRPVIVSQRTRPHIKLAVTSISPSGENATPQSGRKWFEGAVRIRMLSPEGTSQRLAVPSAQAAASVRPSAENMTQLTCP